MSSKTRYVIAGMLCAVWALAACAPQAAPTPSPTALSATDTSVPPSAVPVPTEAPPTAVPSELPPTAAPAPTDIPPTDTPVELPPEPAAHVVRPEEISAIDRWLTAAARQGAFSGSVLVAHQGELLLNKGYGLAEREQNISNSNMTRYRIGGLTQQFTAMAVLILQSQGKLDVQEALCSYLDTCPAGWDAISIYHLLTHTSGIPEYLPAEYEAALAEPASPEQTLALIQSLPAEFAPGAGFSYSSSGYFLLGLVIERAAGQPYEDFLKQAVFAPLNMHDSGVYRETSGMATGYASYDDAAPVPPIDTSNMRAAADLYATIGDLYLWDQALYTEKLLPQSLLEQMFAPQVRVVEQGEVTQTYGYGWKISDENGWTIQTHEGTSYGYAAFIARYPQDEVVIIILSNQWDTELGETWEAITSMLFGD